jgi:hypothetical protein
MAGGREVPRKPFGGARDGSRNPGPVRAYAFASIVRVRTYDVALEIEGAVTVTARSQSSSPLTTVEGSDGVVRATVNGAPAVTIVTVWLEESMLAKMIDIVSVPPEATVTGRPSEAVTFT